MSDTSVDITPGSGASIDTRTEGTNGNHRQVVVLGDPATNAGVAPVDATKGLAVDLSNTGANTNKLLVTPDLPSGAATSAKQDTGNTSLSSIDGKITAVNTGAVVVSSSALPSGAATATKQDTTNATIATKNATSPTVALQIGMSDGTNIQAPQTASGDGVSPWLIAESALGFYNGSGVDRARGDTTNGLDVDVTRLPALAAGTNSIGKLNQPSTPTLTNVTMTGSSVTIQASNASRSNLMIFNDSGVTVYVKLGSSASSSSFTVKMVDQSYYELPAPVYTGIVTALGASGSVRVSEVV